MMGGLIQKDGTPVQALSQVAWEHPELIAELVSEVRAVLLGTVSLTCKVCANSG